MTDDGSVFDVPESGLEAFKKDAQEKNERLRPVKMYAEPDGGIFDVPEDEIETFMQDAQSKGVPVEEVNSFHTMGKTFDVPKSGAAAFYEDWRKDKDADQERVETAKKIAERFDQEDSPLVAGIKGFFDGEGYVRNASMEGASAAVGNVLRAVAQAPATIADKALAAEQFTSRIRTMPNVNKVAAPVLGAMGVANLGPVGEAVTELIGSFTKDPLTGQVSPEAGSAWRNMLGKAREYIDGKKQEFLGFKNEKGEDASADDIGLTIVAQAANSVAEAYVLSAPAIMQKANEFISLGKFSPTIQTILYGASTAEDTAGKAEKAGRSKEEQVALGMLTGTLEGAFESVSQKFGLQGSMGSEQVKRAMGRMLVKMGLQAVGEGATEGAQEFQKAAIEKLAKVDDRTWTQIGAQVAQATAAGLLSGGAAEISHATMAGVDGLQLQEGGQVDELRADQAAEAVELGGIAEQGSVLGTDQAAAAAGEGEFQKPAAQPDVAGDPRQGAAVPEPGVGLEGDPAVAGETMRGNEEDAGLEDGLVEIPEADFRTAGERLAQAQPLDLGRGVKAQGIVRIGRKDGKGKGIESVKLLLPNGRPFYSEDPGLMALTRYWYKDRVLFPPAPAGDRGAQDGDIALNISRRLGYVVKPGKTVLVNVGKSKKAYMGHVVQVLDNNTVRVMIDKTQRSLGNNRAGYADVDIRQIQQLASVIGKQRREALMAGMPKEQKDRINEQSRAFDQELVDQGYFINQESWMEADAMPGKTGRQAKDAERAAAYRRAAQMLGVPLDNHIQRAAALELLQDFSAGMQGTEVGIPYDAIQEQLAREAEQEMQDRRASGEFSLEAMTPEEMAAADANLEAQRVAQEARRKMLARAAAP